MTEDSIIGYNTVASDKWSITLRIHIKSFAVQEFNHNSDTIIF